MRSSRPLILVLVLLGLLALATAGCGGGSSETTATAATTEEKPPPLTKAELIKQGDAICAEVNAAVGSVGSSAATPSDQAGQVANLYTGMVSNLEKLGPPREDPAEYMRFTQAAEELAKVEGEAKLAAEREDTAAIEETASAATAAREEFQTQAGIYGFEQCSKEASAPAPAAGSSSGGGSSGGEAEGGGVASEPEYTEPEYEEEVPPEEETAPETGGAGGEAEHVAPEAGGETGTGGGIGPG